MWAAQFGRENDQKYVQFKLLQINASKEVPSEAEDILMALAVIEAEVANGSNKRAVSTIVSTLSVCVFVWCSVICVICVYVCNHIRIRLALIWFAASASRSEGPNRGNEATGRTLRTRQTKRVSSITAHLLRQAMALHFFLIMSLLPALFIGDGKYSQDQQKLTLKCCGMQK